MGESKVIEKRFRGSRPDFWYMDEPPDLMGPDWHSLADLHRMADGPTMTMASTGFAWASDRSDLRRWHDIIVRARRCGKYDATASTPWDLRRACEAAASASAARMASRLGLGALGFRPLTLPLAASREA